MTAIETKIPDVINLREETDYNTKISGVEFNYFVTIDYNKLTSETSDAKIK